MNAGTAHPTELLIGGELVAGTGPDFAVENPFTTETTVAADDEVALGEVGDHRHVAGAVPGV